jgi:hypothetical protein
MAFEDEQVTFDETTQNTESENQSEPIDENSVMGNNREEKPKSHRGRPKKGESSTKPAGSKKAKIKDCEVEITEDSHILSTDDLKLNADTWSVRDIYIKYTNSNKLLDFEIPQQRAVVWKKDRKSAYIHSILAGLYKFQPAFIVNQVGKGKMKLYQVYDGKQRMLGSIVSYLNDEFTLCGLKNDPLIECNGHYYNVNGCKFSQLPEELKEKLRGASMNVLIADNASEEIMRFIMLRINSGEQMTPFDVARIRRSDMDDFEALSKHGIFKAMLTANKFNQKKYHEIIAKTYIALYEEEPKFSGKHINEIIENLEISEEKQEEINGIYDKLLGAYNILNDKGSAVVKTMFNITNFTSYLRYVNEFDNSKRLADWLDYFFWNTPEEYSSNHSTTKNEILTRMNIIKNSIDEFLSKQ